MRALEPEEAAALFYSLELVPSTSQMDIGALAVSAAEAPH